MAPAERTLGWIVLIGALAVFMALIGGVHALDRHGFERFGYRPFALPNLAFMLIPHGILAAWFGALGGTADAPGLTMPFGVWVLLAALGICAVLFMLVTLVRRTNGQIALIATTAMTLAASVLILSMLFRDLAQAPSDPERR